MQDKTKLFAFSAIALSVTAAYAQDTILLDSVVVSASRMEQKTLEAPASVSVVSGDTLTASGAIRVTEALTAKVPGLYMRAGAGTEFAPEHTLFRCVVNH